MDIAALIIGILALIMSIANFIVVWGEKHSTHTIQYVSPEQLGQSDKEMTKAAKKSGFLDFDDEDGLNVL